jgi:dTDP-4-dehydrorhamnose 3,5-epimerase
MIFTAGRISGSYIIDVERRSDERGFFARSWCEKEFAAHGLSARIMQINIGVSPRAGTLRGLHFQLPPFEEVKVVSCPRGAAYDVVVDLRSGSPTFGQWMAVELNGENARMLYVPEGCAHGYLTLFADSQVQYLTSQAYASEAARGVRFDDPAFAIEWPRQPDVVSLADRNWPLFDR